MIDYQSPDLTQHPPRSSRVRLGGFAHLPRLLDKARATLRGKIGLYGYGPASSMDRYFFEFCGIDAEVFIEAVKTGASDGEMLAWVQEHLQPRRAEWEIAHWSSWLESVGSGSALWHTWHGERITDLAPDREDVQTWCELLDLDDYVSFGGKG